MNASLILYVLVLLPSFLVANARLETSNSPSPPPNENSKVYIIFMSQKPANLSHEAYYVGVLSKVLGSEKAAKEAILYSYRTFSAFAAKLNEEQISRLKKQDGVLGVMESKNGHLTDVITT